MPPEAGLPERVASAADAAALQAVFAPRCVAVYGASLEPGSMGRRAIDNLRRGSPGLRLAPINPRHAGQVVDGTTWYARAVDHPGTVDHAVVLVRAEAVEAVVADCIAAGVRSISILSGGFSEIGPDGERIQARVAELARAAGIRVLGPNCLGFVNTADGVYASPASVFEVVWPGSGPLAVVSQSGAVAADILARADAEGMDASFWVSTGNEIDLAIADGIAWACRIGHVRVIALYLESIRDVAAFRAAAGRARELGKRIVAIRPGRTPAGAQAVQSHTAALVTQDVLYDAVLRQLGIVRVDSQRELVDVLRVAAALPCRPAGLAIVTSSGGSGAMTADAAWASGVPLATITARGRARMKALVPACAPGNPIDMTGATNQNPAMLPEFFSAVLDEPQVDCMVMVHGSAMRWRDRAEKISATLIGMARRYPAKHILFVGTVEPDLRAALESAGVAVFDDSVALVNALGRLPPAAAAPETATASDAPPSPPASAGNDEAVGTDEAAGADEAAGTLPEDRALDLLERDVGLPVVARRLLAGDDDLHEALGRLPLPWAMKAVIAGVTHKTELGAVRIGLDTERAAAAAFGDLAGVCRSRGAPVRILAEAMVGDVVSEVLLSATFDPLLGAFVTVGAGGTLAERVDDVVVAPAPVTRTDAAALLRRLRGWSHMIRHRDGRRGSEAELVDAIVALSRAIAADPPLSVDGCRVTAIEINPFMLRPRGSCAVDAVVATRPRATD